MRRTLLALLALSLAVNAWLLLRPRAPQPPAAAPAPSLPREPQLAVSLFSGSSEALLAALRGMDADDATVRIVIEGVMRRRNQEVQTQALIERHRHGWWRVSDNSLRAQDTANKTQLATALRKTLGVDPLDLVDAESRYPFLPSDKRRRLAQIDLDYADLTTRNRTDGATQSQEEARVEKLLAAERERDLLALLSPAERAEYDLRFGGAARIVGLRATTMGATEQEVRALKPHVDDLERRINALSRNDEDYLNAYNALQRQAAEQLVATLGPERTATYLWASVDSSYAEVRRATEAARLEAGTPTKAMQLWLETGLAASAIHQDSTLSLPQKQAALITLQQATHAKLDILLGGSAQRALGELPRWLTTLSTGSYHLPMVSVAGSGGSASHSLASPPPKQLSSLFDFLRPDQSR